MAGAARGGVDFWVLLQLLILEAGFRRQATNALPSLGSGLFIRSIYMWCRKRQSGERIWKGRVGGVRNGGARFYGRSPPSGITLEAIGPYGRCGGIPAAIREFSPAWVLSDGSRGPVQGAPDQPPLQFTIHQHQGALLVCHARWPEENGLGQLHKTKQENLRIFGGDRLLLRISNPA